MCVMQEMEHGVLRQFPFSSALQRMSVIASKVNSASFCVFAKGSPEMIASLSIPKSGNASVAIATRSLLTCVTSHL